MGRKENVLEFMERHITVPVFLFMAWTTVIKKGSDFSKKRQSGEEKLALGLREKGHRR